MNSLDCLKNDLIKLYKTHNKHIDEIHKLLENYSGEDWKEYIKINEKSYNRHVYYNSKEF